MKIISNATPLISLTVCGQLDLLPQLFQQIIIPRQVYDEVVRGYHRPGALEISQVNWLQIVNPTLSPTIEPLLLGLDAGEMAVLLLAKELSPDWVLIDERRARRVAQAMGMPLKGTLGIILLANLKGLLTSTEAINATTIMTQQGIRISAYWQNWLINNLK